MTEINPQQRLNLLIHMAENMSRGYWQSCYPTFTPQQKRMLTLAEKALKALEEQAVITLKEKPM